MVDTAENTVANRDNADRAYNLIMKEKETLPSFDIKLKFIFSHSALKEGWDNPNVFQICTLKHSQSVISKRQEIGRGLRICVNSNGERMDSSVLNNEFFDMNKLTVVASESYDTFAKELQKEIVESLSERPTKLTNSVLKDRVLKNEKGEKLVIDEQTSMDLIFEFKIKGYIDDDYQITDELIKDIESDKFEVPEKLKDFKTSVIDLLLGIYSTANYKASQNEKANNIDEKILKPNGNFAKKEFKDLWNKIKIQTVYEVDFDTNEFYLVASSYYNSI